MHAKFTKVRSCYLLMVIVCESMEMQWTRNITWTNKEKRCVLISRWSHQMPLTDRLRHWAIAFINMHKKQGMNERTKKATGRRNGIGCDDCWRDLDLTWWELRWASEGGECVTLNRTHVGRAIFKSSFFFLRLNVDSALGSAFAFDTTHGSTAGNISSASAQLIVSCAKGLSSNDQVFSLGT